jgi:hypothetical protein
MVFLAQANEYPTFLVPARVVEEGTAILNMNVLDHPNPSPHGRGMAKDEHAPALLLGMLLQQILEPNGLGLGDVDFVRGEGRRPETGRTQADAEGLFANLMTKSGKF